MPARGLRTLRTIRVPDGLEAELPGTPCHDGIALPHVQMKKATQFVEFFKCHPWAIGGAVLMEYRATVFPVSVWKGSERIGH
jgi:hypothetical protein